MARVCLSRTTRQLTRSVFVRLLRREFSGGRACSRSRLFCVVCWRDEMVETVHCPCHCEDDAEVEEEKSVMFVNVVLLEPGACHGTKSRGDEGASGMRRENK